MHYFIYYVLPFLVVLGVLIFFHELGHFLVAKYFGITVLKFSLGFGPKLLGKRIGETEYLISAIPLGGYVKMLGENDDEEEDPIPPEDEEKSFSHKPPIQRIAVVGAGPRVQSSVGPAHLLRFFRLHRHAGPDHRNRAGS